MSIELTVQQIIDSIEPLKELLNVPLPAQTSFRITRLVTKLNAELEAVRETIARSRKKYEDEEGDVISATSQAEFDEEMKALMESTVSVNFQKINPGVMGSAAVKPGTLLALLWIFEE